MYMSAQMQEGITTYVNLRKLRPFRQENIFHLLFTMTALLFVVGQWCQKTKHTLRFEEVLSIIYYLTCIKHKQDTHHNKST